MHLAHDLLACVIEELLVMIKRDAPVWAQVSVGVELVFKANDKAMCRLSKRIGVMEAHGIAIGV